MERYGFPSQEDYYKQELATVKHLLADAHMSNRVYAEARFELLGLMSKLMSKSNNCISFYFPFDACLEGKNQRIHLGGAVGFSCRRLKSASYWIEIFGVKGSEQQNAVVRRIHFDAAIPGVEANKSEHPLYHVQFAGRSHEEQSRELESQRQFSYPRVPFTPLSIALFFDFAIRELGTDDLKNVIKNGAWRRLVRSNEKLMLMPFFSNLHKRWQDDHQFIFSDLYYESGD